MTNPNARPKIFVVPTVPGVEPLAVRMTRDLTNASNGIAYHSGQTYGFEKSSAVSIVTNDAGLAFCFDEAAADRWLAALMPLHDAGKLSAQGMLNLLVGPPVDKLRADKAAMHDSMERAEVVIENEEAAAKAKAEAEAKAKAIEVEAEERAQALRDAEAKAKLAAQAAQEKANNDANERARAPVDSSRTVSSANVSDALEVGLPPSTPAAPKTSPRRGR